MTSTNGSKKPELKARGEMADRVRVFDWGKTSLGPYETWPQSLRTAVDIALNSRFPTMIFWGPELINIYNDAHAPMLGKRHPEALGMPGKEVWADVWPVIAEQVDGVMKRGESTWNRRGGLVVERNGAPEHAWFSWSYSPIHDENGEVMGLWNVAMEETDEVEGELERERLAKEMLRQARVFDTTLSSITDFAYILDRDARFVYVNKALLDLWGLKLEDAVGKDFFDLKYPVELAARLAAEVREVFETGKTLQRETPYESPSGQAGYYEYIFSPVMGPDGKVEVIAGSTRDITERKRLEVERERLVRTLDAERANLASIIEQSPSFIVAMSGPEHVVELANEGYYKLIGRKGIVGKTIREAQPEVSGQGFFELLDNVYRTGEPYVGNEVLVVLGPGVEGQRYVNFVYQAVRGADGKVSGVFCHGVDVTALVRSREKVEASEKQRRLALDAAELGAWHWDPATNAFAADARFHAIFGVPDKTLGYEQAVAMIHPADRERTLAVVTRAIRDMEVGTYSIEHRVVRPDGSARWVQGKGRANFELGEKRLVLTSFDGTLADITERKHIEEEREALLASEQAARSQVERVSRMKDEFLVTLSHEIRTPLTAILGWSQIIRKSAKPEDLGKGLDVIERNARSQSKIIEDLLDMSRIISGKVRLDVKRLDLAGLVAASVETARPTAEAKGVKLEAAIDPLTELTVSGDAGRVQQVMWNLISNAVKFTPRGGRIGVALERRGSHLEIRVTDTGEGISEEFLPYVFDRFRQADASTTRKHGGLGLGLSIVKQLVELHGGWIDVTSAGAGKGSTFRVRLPLEGAHEETEPSEMARKARAEASAATTQADGHKAIAGVRVLVLDDEVDTRDLVKRLLEDGGAVVTLARSVDEAIKGVETGMFDVLVSDIGMPGEDGYSLMRRVRTLGKERCGDIPAIALTAYARAEDRVKAVSAGFTAHVSKPVESGELVTVVAGVVKR